MMNRYSYESRLQFKAGSSRQTKCHPDLSATKGAQGFRFDTGLQCFKYAFLAAAHKTLKNDSTMKNLDRLPRNGGDNFPKVNFD
jgi:hypothetical protein